MKNRLLTTSLLLLAAMGVLFASCKKEYPQPPIQNLPIGTVYTIDEIVAMTPGTVFDTASVYGIVTADEQSGNLYKAAYIQDRATGAAIQLYLNAVSGVRIGDSVRIYLKDVKFDMYHGLPQLSEFGPDGHIIILANNRPIEPEVTTLANVNSGQHLAQLIRLEGVTFVDQEGTFAPSTGYGEHYIQDAFGNTAMVRTSNYANFANNPLPQGTGNLVAIASVYNTTWQLTLRSYYELEFDGMGPGPITPGEVQSLPYTQLFSTGFGSYMSYSVIDDEHFWTYESSYSIVQMTGHVQDANQQHYYYDNDDWLISSPVDLSGVSEAKMTMSYLGRYFNNINNDVTILVSDNYTYGEDPTAAPAQWTQLPANLVESSTWSDFKTIELSLTDFVGKTVTVAVRYISNAADNRAGTMEVQSIVIDEGSAGDGPTPPTPGEGEGSGTADDPYNVAAGISQQTSIVAWVHGYIVGAVKDGQEHNTVSSNDDIDWAAPFGRATNVLIADDASCNDIANCLIVKMPAGSALRSQVNLKDHPENLGKELAVNGTLKSAFGQPGVDSPGTESDFVFDGGDPTPPEPPTPGEGIFSETFANGQGDFTIQDVELAGLSYVWNYMTSYHCMKANGYYQGAHATESWLVSPQIDLTNVSNATLKFDHAVAFASAEGSFFVMVSTDYTGDVTTATWTELNIGSWPEPNSSWVFEGASADMSSFVGQNVTIAFKYTSTMDVCPAWEVKNVVVE